VSKFGAIAVLTSLRFEVPRGSSIVWEPRIMKRRSLVRIFPPPLVCTKKKKKKKKKKKSLRFEVLPVQKNSIGQSRE